jgi:hypothetical protein
MEAIKNGLQYGCEICKDAFIPGRMAAQIDRFSYANRNEVQAIISAADGTRKIWLPQFTIGTLFGLFGRFVLSSLPYEKVVFTGVTTLGGAGTAICVSSLFYRAYNFRNHINQTNVRQNVGRDNL